MGRDCKYCGAYISDIVDVCPACGKKVRAEKKHEDESYNTSASAAAAAAQKEVKEEQGNTSGKNQGTYTYKQEYQYRYGQYKSSSQRAKQGEYHSSNQRQYDGGYRSQTSGSGISAEDDDVRNNKAISYLCYFGPLFLIPYLTRSNSDFVKFHSNQGLLLLLASLLTKICDFIPILGWMISVAGTLFVIAGFFQGLSNVSKGIKKPLPLIGEIKLLG